MNRFREERRQRRHPNRGLSVVVVAGLLLGALNGCQGRLLNPASSMRIEVEVYKGPLSKQPDTQMAELRGLMDETEKSLEHYNKALQWVLNGGKGSGRATADENTANTECKAKIFDKKLGCLYLESIRNDLIDLKGTINDLGETSGAQNTSALLSEILAKSCRSPARTKAETPARTNAEAPARTKAEAAEAAPCAELIAWLGKVMKFAARLKVKALYWANAQAAAPHWSRTVRVSAVNFSNLAAQVGNQLIARADALVKQIEGKDQHALPLSVFLRDSSPTDFPNLLTWNRAVAPALPEEMLFHPTTAFSSEETVDRVRVVERLFADEYWTKINTVYASGESDVSTALIKDDIGNWNLKSFTADPSELLEAYTKFTISAVSKAAELAASAGSGGSTEALKLASSLTRRRIGGDDAQVQGIDLKALKTRTIHDLQDLKRRAAEKESSLLKEARSGDVAEHRAKVLEEAEFILAKYGAVIEALEDGMTLEETDPD